MCIFSINTRKVCKSGWDSWLLFQRSLKRGVWDENWDVKSNDHNRDIPFSLGMQSQKIYKKKGRRADVRRCASIKPGNSYPTKRFTCVCPALLTDLIDPCAATWVNSSNSTTWNVWLNKMVPQLNQRISPGSHASNSNQHLPQQHCQENETNTCEEGDDLCKHSGLSGNEVTSEFGLRSLQRSRTAW